MLLTTAREIQKKFKAGLQICGENKEGELEWIGNNEQWKKSEELTEEEVDELFEPTSLRDAETGPANNEIKR